MPTLLEPGKNFFVEYGCVSCKASPYIDSATAYCTLLVVHHKNCEKNLRLVLTAAGAEKRASFLQAMLEVLQARQAKVLGPIGSSAKEEGENENRDA